MGFDSPAINAKTPAAQESSNGFFSPYEAAVEHVPGAIADLGHELAAHPLDTGVRVLTDVGSSAAIGFALSHFVPAGGPAAFAIGAAMTLPLVIKGAESLVKAHEEASKPGANADQIGKNLADSFVSNGFDAGLSFAGGWAGAEGAYRLADSNTTAGAMSRGVRTKVLNFENKGLMLGKNALDFLRPSGSAAAVDAAAGADVAAGMIVPKSGAGIVAPDLSASEGLTGKSFTDLHTTTPKSVLENMSYLGRTKASLAMRVGQLSQTSEDTAGLQPYNLLIHAHTILSDGDAQPGELYSLAKDAGYDGAITSEHDHILARKGVPPSNERAQAEEGTPIIGSDPQELQTQRDAAAQISVPGQFFADGGEEVGVIGHLPPKTNPDGTQQAHGANHTGIYNDAAYVRSDETRPTPTLTKLVNNIRGLVGLAPKESAPIAIQDIPDGRFDLVAQYLNEHADPNNPTVAVLNHPRIVQDFSPNTPANLQGHDYGMSLWPSFDDWLANWGDKYAKEIEVMKGGALSPVPPKDGVIPPHYYNLTDAQIMWDKGYHGGVSAGPDIHYKARVGEPPLATTILGKSLDRSGVYEALSARRTSVTSNFKKLTAYMTANDGQYMMGNILDGSVVGSNGLAPEVHIGGQIDPSASYQVNIWQDPKVGDGQRASIVQTKTVSGADLQGMNNTVKFDPLQSQLGDQSLFYAEVQRTDGSSPTYGDIMGTNERNADGTPKIVTTTADGTFVNGLTDLLEVDHHVETVDYGKMPVSPEVEEAANMAPNTPYPEKAFTSPIFIDPPSGGATHSLLMRGLPGASAVVNAHSFLGSTVSAAHASALSSIKQQG